MNTTVEPSRDVTAMGRTTTRFFGRDLGFSIKECAKMHGLSEKADSLGDLEKALGAGHAGTNVVARCVRLFDIKIELDERYKGDHVATRLMLRNPIPRFNGTSLYSLIASGRFDDLGTALAFLENMDD